MNRYAITEKAGRFVAGQTNTGVGSVLTLTDKQAEHELRLGTLQPLDGVAAGKKVGTGKGKKVARGEPKPATDEDAGEGVGDE